jgi:glycine/D-amino acid oxidase-like deaminating enzyme
MDLRSHYPFWLLRDGILNNYASQNADLQAEVVIIGAGITGALIGYTLAKAGIHVILLDRRHAGMGSTCASTALLQYEIDVPLHQLIELAGRKNAFRSYELCAEAILKIEKITSDLETSVGFERKKSLFFASTQKDVEIIDKELPLRKKLGIGIEYLTQQEIEDKFNFKAPAALLSDLGAQVDAYSLTHALLQQIKKMGGEVFDNTDVIEIHTHTKGVTLKTSRGFEIKAPHLVMAAGYESREHLPDKTIIKLSSTYALVSEPLPDFKDLWQENCLIWETAQPYLYIRTTDDNRILVGGKDEPFYNPNRRDALLKRKTKALENTFRTKMPHIPLITDFSWTGTFAQTKDGLPYIGKIKQMPHTFFALGFGGNGITFSMVGAEIIKDHITGRKNNDEKIFSFTR